MPYLSCTFDWLKIFVLCEKFGFFAPRNLLESFA